MHNRVEILAEDSCRREVAELGGKWTFNGDDKTITVIIAREDAPAMLSLIKELGYAAKYKSSSQNRAPCENFGSH